MKNFSVIALLAALFCALVFSAIYWGIPLLASRPYFEPINQEILKIEEERFSAIFAYSRESGGESHLAVRVTHTVEQNPKIFQMWSSYDYDIPILSISRFSDGYRITDSESTGRWTLSFDGVLRAE